MASALNDTSKQHHLLPFTIDMEGPIDAAKYLSVIPSTTPKINVSNWVDACPRQSTVIMGRLLEGIEITPPEHCQGHVWNMETAKDDDHIDSDNGYDDDYEDHDDHDDEQISTNNAGKILSRSTTTVDSFVLWKKDVAPSPMDPRLNAMESWIDIANLVHKPIPLSK